MPSPLLLLTDLAPGEAAAWHTALARAMPDETIVPWTPHLGADRLAAIEIAIVANPPPGVLETLPALRWIQSLWAGVDKLLASALPDDVPVVRMIDPALGRAMAEAVAAIVLHLHRDFPRYAAQQQRGDWRQLPLVAAADRAVTILGLGEMGAAAASMLANLGFRVTGWSRSPRDLPGIRTHAGPAGLATALTGADILVNLLPLTPDTRGILGAATFAQLAPGAAIVNVGRGGHLVERDLLEALEAGRIGHAVLDVFETEPLPRDHPFWSHPKVTVLPHVTAPTNMPSAAAIVARAIAAYRRNGTIPPTVDRGRGY
jgi:glyoxylate/hydroxypyruvate reductase A